MCIDAIIISKLLECTETRIQACLTSDMGESAKKAPIRLACPGHKIYYTVLFLTAVIFIFYSVTGCCRNGTMNRLQQAPSFITACRRPSEALYVAQFPGSKKYVDYAILWHDVYKPAGYCGCREPSQTPCWLSLHKHVDCRQSFTTYASKLQTHVPVYPPPHNLPDELSADFLLNGHTQLGEWYVDEAGHAPTAKTPVWDSALLDSFIAPAKRQENMGSYGHEIQALYNAFSQHNITGQHGAVFGSQTPWLEGFLFAYGASRLTTIEYRRTISRVPNLHVITPLEWASKWLDGTAREVDFAVSFSSLEHDGLGRYGDPVNPWGDIESMQRASCYVKSGGLMFLAVPTAAKDMIAYNAHRYYGPARFPLLTANWQVLGVYTHDRKVTADTCYNFWDFIAKAGIDYRAANFYQPVVVLRNHRLSPCTV